MKIPIKGVIVANDEKWIYEMFDMEVTTPKDVSELIDQAKGEQLEVIINSPGGDVYSGSEIYTALMDYKGPVNVKVVGIAASAASVIAMAGGVTKISPTAQIMMHNVHTIAQGDYRDFEHESEVLKNYNQSIANAYMLKTGLSKEELLELMDNETWLTAQSAKEYGFVDEIMFDTGNQLAASVNTERSFLLSRNVINKIRNSLVDEDLDNDGEEHNEDLEIYRKRLNLLKLRSENKC